MEWAEVIDNPLLQDLPFKIELNKWGKILLMIVPIEISYFTANGEIKDSAELKL